MKEHACGANTDDCGGGADHNLARNCVAEGAAWLAQQETRFAHALSLTGELPLRRKPDGFEELLSAIISQQVSVASARAILGTIERCELHQPGRDPCDQR